MPLYSFKGQYPVEQIDNNKGWYEVPNPPIPPEGKEVRWLNAEWVVRDPKPEDRPGWQWNWNQTENGWAWVECEFAQTALPEPEVSLTIEVAASEPISIAVSYSESVTSVAEL